MVPLRRAGPRDILGAVRHECQGQGGRIRVLVADDHARVRAALGQLLASLEDVEVVGYAVDGAQAVELAAQLAPDVVVMDVSMPGVDGIEATRRILEANPGLRVVTLTAFRQRQEDAYRAGASAHVLKDAAPEELIRCVRAGPD